MDLGTGLLVIFALGVREEKKAAASQQPPPPTSGTPGASALLGFLFREDFTTMVALLRVTSSVSLPGC